MDDFMEAMTFRHACKRFEGRRIPEEVFDRLLEYGRMSPSSFGMEPWRFIVITGAEEKAALRPHCWEQPQITECSHLLVIAAENEAVRPGSAYVKKMFGRRGLPEEALQRYLQRYHDHMTPQFHSREAVEAWTHKQCYLAAANMMTGAAALKVDSCPIEGFDKTAVERTLKLPASRSVALLIAFGYRLDPQGEHLRLPPEELVTRR